MGARSGIVRVNGTPIYHEVRGNGPTVLMIAGATGDAGHFSAVAQHLADEFTVITYDRRGNSRSSRPERWTATTMDEQGDDAAALLRALGAAPAAVFGTSGGAVILLNLIVRHPDVLRGAIVHEPPLMTVLPDAAEMAAMLEAQVRSGLASIGPRGTLEGFIRENAGEDAFEALDPALRERMLGNAEVFFSLELQPITSYVPPVGALCDATLPVFAAYGSGNREHPVYRAPTEWVATAMGSDSIEIPGTHAPYFLLHEELADALRPLLRKTS